MSAVDGGSDQHPPVSGSGAPLPQVEGDTAEAIASRFPPALPLVVVPVGKILCAGLPEMGRPVDLQDCFLSLSVNEKVDEVSLQEGLLLKGVADFFQAVFDLALEVGDTRGLQLSISLLQLPDALLGQQLRTHSLRYIGLSLLQKVEQSHFGVEVELGDAVAGDVAYEQLHRLRGDQPELARLAVFEASQCCQHPDLLVEVQGGAAEPPHEIAVETVRVVLLRETGVQIQRTEHEMLLESETLACLFQLLL